MFDDLEDQSDFGPEQSTNSSADPLARVRMRTMNVHAESAHIFVTYICIYLTFFYLKNIRTNYKLFIFSCRM
jgi:hypothetical protein